MQALSILIVDDEPNNFDVLEALLDSNDYALHYAASGQEAVAALELFRPDLILLDVMMPVMDGIEVCQWIKAMNRWQSVPIVMVTALNDKQTLARCLDAGADDFISKPVNYLELNARVRSMLRIRQQHQQLVSFNARLEETVRQRTAQLRNSIFQDSLTQLPSRAYLLEALTERLTHAESSVILIILDCDRFHLVNDTFGCAFGNRLLVAIAKRLQQHVHPRDLLARFGEDEFCFLLNSTSESDLSAIERFLEAISSSFGQPFIVDNCEIFMSVCMGIAIGKDTQQTAAELLQDADTAMYQAKLKGKGNIRIFDPKMRLETQRRLVLETELQRGLEKQEFITVYQPIICLQTLKLAGFEALIRWQHPEKGSIAPGHFIPSMEATGLIVPVGLLILRQACQQLRIWQQQGQSYLTMSVNLSVRQFTSPSFLQDIDRVLAETKVDPASLKLEITESTIIDSAENAIALTQALRSRQIQISIDDFGTGYSSLGCLNRLPVDALKIDRSFVKKFPTEGDRHPVVNAIMTLGQELGLAIIAEGIETQAQLAWLQRLKCDFGQGYFFSKPLSVAEIERRYLH